MFLCISFFKKCIQALKRIAGDCTIHTDFKSAGIFSFAQTHVMNVNLLFLLLLFLLMQIEVQKTQGLLLNKLKNNL